MCSVYLSSSRLQPRTVGVAQEDDDKATPIQPIYLRTRRHQSWACSKVQHSMSTEHPLKPRWINATISEWFVSSTYLVNFFLF